MSNANNNDNQQLKENLKMICNQIETVLAEFKDLKEKNNKLKAQQAYSNDPNSKINTINKIKQKIASLQNSLENVYDINNINKKESEIKKKITLFNKLSEEQVLLSGLLKNQKKDIDAYSSKFKDNKEINEIKSKLNLEKEENHLKRESFKILNAKIKGQLSKIDVLEKQIKIIKQNIEYQKNKQKKEVKNSLAYEEGENDENEKIDLNDYIATEQQLIYEIGEEERSFLNEIYQQNELIQNIKDEINKYYDHKKKQRKEKEEKITQIRLIKLKNNGKIKKKENTEIKNNIKGSNIDNKIKINNINTFSNKNSVRTKNEKNPNNNINFRINTKPFKSIKFNEIYKNIIGHNTKNKNIKNKNIYISFNEKNLEVDKKNIEKYNENLKLKHKSKISNDIEKLRNEITFALKNNVVIFNKPTNIQDSQIILNDEKINKNENNNELNHKTSNKPFDKFNFS